jgi:hypothetical protein
MVAPTELLATAARIAEETLFPAALDTEGLAAARGAAG